MVDLMQYDQVKNTGPSSLWKFGFVERHSKEALAFAKKDKLVVEEAVTGQRFAVRLSTVEKVPYGKAFDQETGAFDDELSQFVNTAFETAQAEDAALKSFGVKALICYPMGDGLAFYVVTRCTKRAVRLAWRGFSGDRWRHPAAVTGRMVPRQAIEDRWDETVYMRELYRLRMSQKTKA